MDLDLGRYTVVVGPSSSGKSALMRAFRAVASNVRGAGTITRGQKFSAITVRTGEHVVTLERTDSFGSYRVVDPAGKESVFTKLNGGVPPAVTAALRIAPVPTTGTSVNFAGQFDKPYLLGESGATVAKVLGELTNVNTIFEAVALANKYRKSAAATLKTRQKDLEALQARLGDFLGLSGQLSKLDATERRYAAATALSERVDRLTAAVGTLTTVEDTLTRVAVLPEVPDPQPIYERAARLRTFTGLLTRIGATSASAAVYTEQVQQHTEAEQQATDALAAALRAAGRCPTCGQQVH